MKKKLIALFAFMLVTIICLVSSFADEFTIDEIFEKQCMTSQESILFKQVDGQMVQESAIGSDELLLISQDESIPDVPGYKKVVIDNKIYYIQDANLKNSQEFKDYCLQNGYLWAHAKSDVQLYSDADLTQPAFASQYNDALQVVEQTEENLFVMQNSVVSVIDLFDNSVHISLSSGDSGYISYDSLTFEISKDENFGNAINYNLIRSEVVKTALNYEGGRYIWGGTDLDQGVDCSGFTMMIYKKYGIELSHSASSQAVESNEISMEELQPGDLIFYNGYKEPGQIGHVAIYIGNNQIVHAQSTKTGITVSDINYSEPLKFGRVL